MKKPILIFQNNKQNKPINPVEFQKELDLYEKNMPGYNEFLRIMENLAKK